MKRISEVWLSALIVVLAVPAHLTGLLVPSVYRDPAAVLPQNLGTDLVTLCVGIPLLALTTVALRRRSVRARVLWLGALGYLAYAYGMYALGVRWNPFFLVYVALFGLSLFALIIGLVETDADAIRASVAGRAPVRSVATYLMLIAVLVAAIWLAEEVGALLRGTVPPSVLQFEAPTSIVHVFDLGIVLPTMALAAVMLLRGRPWGYVLAGVLLVKATTIGLWVLAMVWFSARRGFRAPVAYTAFFALLTGIGAMLTWRFLTALDSPERSPCRARYWWEVTHMTSATALGGRLIDRFLPQADVRERHETLVRARPDVVFDVAWNFDLWSIPLVRAIFWLRATFLGAAKPPRDLFSRGLVAETTAMGWGMLTHRPGRELVMGAVTRPWVPNVTFTPIVPERFATFSEPDVVKIIWTLEADPLGPALTRFRTETRVLATDDGARRKFGRYWRTFGAGIVLIRWLLLPALRREAERRYRAPGRPGTD